MVRQKYIVNLTSATATMLNSTKVKVTVAGTLVALALLSTLVYLFLNNPASPPSSSLSPQEQQQSATYRQQFVRNMTSQIWRQHLLLAEDSNSSNLADLRTTFAVLTTLKVMKLEAQFAAAKKVIVDSLLRGVSDDFSSSHEKALKPIDLFNEFLASLLSTFALEENEDDDFRSELLEVVTTKLVPLIEPFYTWGPGGHGKILMKR